MEYFNKIVERFIKANRKLKKWQRVVSVLSAVVVFVTTYAMVLPAITLDKETASAQAGIEIAAGENDPDSSGTVYEAEPEEAPQEEEAEEPQEDVSEESQDAVTEDSGSESGGWDAEESEEDDADEEAETDYGPNTEEQSGDEEAEYLPDETEADTAPDAAEEDASAEETLTEDVTAEEIRLITEETQLTYEYIDEYYADGIDDENDDGIDDGYTVYAEFGAEAKLPEGVALSAEEITTESDPEVYEAYREKALSGLQDKYDGKTELSFARFYDIKFVYNGEEAEPAGDVKVRIKYNKAIEIEEETNVDAVLFDRNKDEEPVVIESEVNRAEDLKAEEKDRDDIVRTVEFESDRISVYGIAGSHAVEQAEDAAPAAAAETAAEGEAAEGGTATEIKLITEDTQLTYKYTDGNKEDGRDDSYIVYAEFGAEAKLPEGVALSAEEITRESDPEAYEAYCEKALSGLQDKYDEKTELSFARFYDIKFVYNGEEVEPQGDVKVRIEYKKAVEIEKETNVDAVHFDKDNGEEPEVIDSETEAEKKGKDDTVKTVEFESDRFSVYGIIGSYTVDFHWEVDGKSFEFSVPGGGFVSFEHLVEVLGIGTGDIDSEAEIDEAVKLNEAEVSEETKAFVADVESVEFSDPALVWVGKVNEAATVGGLKEDNGLEVEYSADLTEEQIAEINAQTVDAGDWALISLQPFTSEETLTVIMKNGEQFVIRVTDYQPAATNMNDFATGNTNRFVIWGTSNGRNYVLKTDGTTEEFDPSTIDTLGADYLWTIEYGWLQGYDQGVYGFDNRYRIRPANDHTSNLALNNDGSGYAAPGDALISTDECGIRLYPPYSRHKNQQNNNYTNTNAGWIVEGWGWMRLNLGTATGSRKFEGNNLYCSDINISRQQVPYTYDIIVQTDDYERGGVSGIDKGGVNRQAAETFTATTNSVSGTTKSNLRVIEAGPMTQKWVFDYWDLDGQTLYWDTAQSKIVFAENENTVVYTNLDSEGSSIINAYSLPVTYNNSKLTAHFKRNPNYEAPDDDKDGRPIDATIAEWLETLLSAEFPLNKQTTQKTAEVYDYENRIFRVDITAASNLYALDKTVKLGFILDVSGSMKFPSKLNMVSSANNTQITEYPEDQLELELYKINDNNTNKRWLDQSKTYYIIADKNGTATVDRIFYNRGDNRWKFTDASKNESNDINWDTKFHSADSTRLTYPIYMAGDPIIAEDFSSLEGNLLRDIGLSVGDPRPRAFYLQRSMRETTATLQDIMDKVSVAADPSKASDVLIAWNTYHKNVNDSDHVFKSPANVAFRYAYSGGTSTDRALNDARDFGWGHDSSTSRFAVLITDGAPQRDGNYVPNTDVANYANSLKANGTPNNTTDDITLVTLGLSMGDVRRGEILLYDIASRDQENVPYYYEAESGNELELALAEIVRIAMANAIVEGNVTDTINEAFYPVDKYGIPLEDGYVINLNGELIAFREGDLTQELISAGYGVVHESNGVYSVTWTGQEFTWAGWRGTIYEKAKEDFLGGNAVRTNDPLTPAVVTSTGYKLKPGDEAIAFKQEIINAGTKPLETPRVNVNELQITQNSTEWTVYLGTEVDPEEQIKALYNEIKVEQVITNGTDTDDDGFKDEAVWDVVNDPYNYPYYFDVVESASDDRENDAYGEQQFFYLKDLIKKLNGGEDIDWEQLIALSELTGDDNTGITIPYDAYGQDNPGWITIKLEKDHDVEAHVTDETGEPVETYTLTVFFSPLYDHIPVGQGGDGLYPYHTGNHGLGAYGLAAGTEESVNEHEINVFAKKLKIEKADQGGNTITDDTAVFVLYRKATDEEMEDDSVIKKDLAGLTGKYVAVQTLTTSEGFVTSEALSLPADNEPYYLVETKAPNGYDMLTEPLKVTIDMTGHNTWTKVADNSTSQTKPDPYELSNWLQEAAIKLWNMDDTIYDPAHTSTHDHTNDTTDASAVYKIINNSGIELPNTGGPGTDLLYLLGIMLTGAAGAGLVMKRRWKNTL